MKKSIFHRLERAELRIPRDVVERRSPDLLGLLQLEDLDRAAVESLRSVLANELIDYGFLKDRDDVPNPYGEILESLIDAVGS